MAIRKNSRRFYYAELFAKYENDIKNTWKIIREIISNTLVINNTTVVEKEEIAENLNKYFTNIGPKQSRPYTKAEMQIIVNIVNYRPISVLLCFSQILERIMYNRLYLYLAENNLLYNKHLDFKKNILLIIMFNSQIKYTKCLIKHLHTRRFYKSVESI